MPDIFVQSYTHLKDMHNADKALHMLQRVSSLVKPIMRKRNWVLPVLAEFFPDNPNLLEADYFFTSSIGLNVNFGQKILVRLRPAHSPDSFLPEEDVIGTLLHELTHNVHGPHDEKFYKYLDMLQDEYDALQRSGYAGEGFFSEGKRLGQNVSHNVSPSIARQKALEAAEKRAKVSRVLGSGGRLGGSVRNAGLSPRELAAKAAEKRIWDEKSCASGEEAKREVDKAANASVTNTVIDLSLENDSLDGSDSDVVIVKDLHPRPVDSSSTLVGSSEQKQVTSLVSGDASRTSPPTGPGRTSSATITKHLKRPKSLTTVDVPATKRQARVPQSSTPPEWSCSICTLINPGNALQCDACQTRRPLDEHEGWTCLSCGECGNPHDHWTCRFCSEVKLFS